MTAEKPTETGPPPCHTSSRDLAYGYLPFKKLGQIVILEFTSPTSTICGFHYSHFRLFLFMRLKELKDAGTVPTVVELIAKFP
jgi:hypothetical protein